MWKEFPTDRSLFDFTYSYLTITQPATLPIDRGIDDKAWRMTGSALDDADALVTGETEEEETAVVAEEDDGDLFSWKST